MHQTVALRKRFLKVRHKFVCSVLHDESHVTINSHDGVGTPVILKQNRRPEGTNRAQIAWSAFVFGRE
jgi:hypothetical protein